MNSAFATAEELRQQGLAKIRANQIEESISLFDEALTLAGDDELIELITINKAGALIALQQSGPEVQKLPQIIMRRRNLRHLYLAAYNLQGKYENERDFARASQYARVALDAAEAAHEESWKTQVLVALGNLHVLDSRFDEAAEYYERGLALLGQSDADVFRRALTQQNLGYCRICQDRLEEGVALIHSAIDLLQKCGGEAFIPESHIDLCYGYLGLGRLDEALRYGTAGLAAATELRQVRNAHYLLGEIAHKQGDIAAADFQFEHLAKFYPDFPHLKHLLHALDLRAMVNFKL